MSAEQRHTAGVTTALILRYVRSRAGDQGVARVMELAGDDRDPTELEDETSWSTYDQKIRLFDAAAQALDDPQVARRIGETVIDQRVGAPIKLLLRALGSPGQVLKNVAKTAPKFSTVCTMEAPSIDSTEAVVTYRLHEGFTPSIYDCDYNVGLMSQVSVLFGLAPATIEHPQCQVEGADLCEYIVRWPRGRRFGRRASSTRVRYLEDQVRNLAERSEALQEATADLVAAGDVDSVLARIASRAAHAVRAHAFVLAVRPTEDSEVHVHSDGLSDEAARELVDGLLSGDEQPTDRMLIAPINSSRREYGLLAALYPDTGGFFPEEEHLLTSYGRHAAAALDAATALEQARDQQRTADALLELAGALAAASTRDEISQRVVDAVAELVGADRSIVYLWDDVTETLHARAASGYEESARESILQLVFKIGDTPFFDSVETLLQPRHITVDTTEDPVVREYMQAYGARESFVVPITVRGELLGLITATAAHGSPPMRMDEVIRQRMMGLADHAGTALENVRLLEQERATVDRLREANAFKSQFLGVVSHELRTPLAAIMGMARTLATRHDQIEASVRNEFLNSIVERGDQLGRLVDDLLHSSREMELRPQSIDLAQLATAAVDTARQLAPHSNIALKITGRIPVVVDGGRLRQVLDNLLTNAVRYAPEALIEVDAGRRDQRIWFSVRDEGPGMSAEELDRAFEAFYQGTLPARKAGVGLGLYISRRIVEAHGGTMRIDSEPGRGTAVLVEVPAGVER
jgi:K+-sensing histidine kinase KdpD